jgi:hypothetical protein
MNTRRSELSEIVKSTSDKKLNLNADQGRLVQWDEMQTRVNPQ